MNTELLDKIISQIAIPGYAWHPPKEFNPIIIDEGHYYYDPKMEYSWEKKEWVSSSWEKVKSELKRVQYSKIYTREMIDGNSGYFGYITLDTYVRFWIKDLRKAWTFTSMACGKIGMRKILEKNYGNDCFIKIDPEIMEYSEFGLALLSIIEESYKNTNEHIDDIIKNREEYLVTEKEFFRRTQELCDKVEMADRIQQRQKSLYIPVTPFDTLYNSKEVADAVAQKRRSSFSLAKR